MAPGKSLESQLSQLSGDGNNSKSPPQRIPSEKLPRGGKSTDGDTNSGSGSGSKGSAAKNGSEASQLVCNACGFEEEFIDEGMYPCEKCHQVYYCSVECLRWDWKGGDHRNNCLGLKDDDASFHSSDDEAESVAVSLFSIDAFEAPQPKAAKTTLSKNDLLGPPTPQSISPTPYAVGATGGTNSNNHHQKQQVGEKRERSVSPLVKTYINASTNVTSITQNATTPGKNKEVDKAELPPPHKKPNDRFTEMRNKAEGGATGPGPTPPPVEMVPKGSSSSNSRFEEMRNKLVAREAGATSPVPPPLPPSEAARRKTGGGIRDKLKLFQKDEEPQNMEWRSIHGKMTLVPADTPHEEPPPKYRPTTPTHDPNMPSVNMETKKRMEAEQDEKALSEAQRLYRTHKEHAETLSHMKVLEAQQAHPSPTESAAVSPRKQKLSEMKSNLTQLQQKHSPPTTPPVPPLSEKVEVEIVEVMEEEIIEDNSGSLSESDYAESDQPAFGSSVASSDHAESSGNNNTDNTAAGSGQDQMHVSLWLHEQDSIVSHLDDGVAWEIEGQGQAEQPQHAQPQQSQTSTTTLNKNHESSKQGISKSMLGGGFESDSEEDEDVLFAPAPMAEADASAGGAARTLPKQQQQNLNDSFPSPSKKRGIFGRVGDFFSGGDNSASSMDNSALPPPLQPLEKQQQLQQQKSKAKPPQQELPQQPPLPAHLSPSSKPPQQQRQSRKSRSPPDPQQQDGNQPSQQQQGRHAQKGGLLPTNDLLGPSTFDKRPNSNGRPDNPFKKSLDRSYQRSLRHREMERKHQQSQSPPHHMENAREGKCKACAIDVDFVSEGLTPCPHCHDVYYCTQDCLQWDWQSGGHSQACSGGGTNGGGLPTQEEAAHRIGDDSDAMSIEAFEDGHGETQQGSVMNYINGARELALQSKPPSGTNNSHNGHTDSVECAACSIDFEYVSDGPKNCPRCVKVSYCSIECLQWHWDNGGHRQACEGNLGVEAGIMVEDQGTAGSDSDMSIEPFDAAQNEAMQQPGSLMARLKAAKLKTHSNDSSPTSVSGRAKRCKACSIDAEFVSDGMIPCSQCRNVCYCSQDCLRWHWKSGGHAKACAGSFANGGTPVQMDDVQLERRANSDDASIEAFDEGSYQSRPPQSQGGVMEALRKSRKENASRNVPSVNNVDSNQNKCNACGMDKEYVPEGMKKCTRCFKVVYCSKDCLSWDWSSGGHLQVCTGVSEAERRLERQNEDAVGDDASIDAFDPNDLHQPQTPNGQGDVLEALRKSKAQTSPQASKAPLPPINTSRCNACGMNEAYVPEGMMRCTWCLEVPYCSVDCRNWDWSSGGHVQVCSALTDAERQTSLRVVPVSDIMDDSEAESIEPFDNPGQPAPQSQAGVLAAIQKSRGASQVSGENLKCQACNTDSEFVPDGMIVCERCNRIHYCSRDCMQWHWRSGGHSKACEGDKGVAAIPCEDESSQDSDQASIDPFGGEEDQAPSTEGGVMEAVAKSRAQASVIKHAFGPLKCLACGIDSECVPDGMKVCPHCNDAPYCSTDCIEWDLTRGGHKNVCKGVSDAERRKTRAVVVVAASAAANISDDDLSIEAFEDEDQGQIQAPQSSAGVLAAINAAKAESEDLSRSASTPALSLKCQACGLEEEFAEEGMIPCLHCLKTTYCSDECKGWDWSNGGHKESCNASHEPTSSAKTKASVASSGPPHSSSIGHTPQCEACGTESDFVSEGMLNCDGCNKASYCSLDCQQWHWRIHKNVCNGTGGARTVPVVAVRDFSDDGSIEAFDPNRDPPPTDTMAAIAASKAQIADSKRQQSKNDSKCKACGMNSNYVSEGMKACKQCSDVTYCSLDCMEWDWNSGGHKDVCKGTSDADRQEATAVVVVAAAACIPDDDMSIEAFEGGSQGQMQAPQSSAGVLAAINAAKAQTEDQSRSVDQPAFSIKCQACGMEEEFVPEGMKECPTCLQVTYCSDECKDWDWNSGGHRDSCGTKQHEEINVQSMHCEACGMESEFVSEEMLGCDCNRVHYCSSDCQQWHWRIHKNDCKGSGEGAQTQMAARTQMATGVCPRDDDSIDAFDPNQEQAPSSSGDVMGAVAAAKAATAGIQETQGTTELHSIGKDEKAAPEFGAQLASAALQVNTFDDDETEEATSRLQTYRRYLVSTVFDYLQFTDREGTHLGEHVRSDAMMEDLERGSSSSDSTGLGSIGSSSSSDDDSQLSDKLNTYLSKNVSGAMQLATPTDDGDLPSYMDTTQPVSSLPPSSMDMGMAEVTYSSYNKPLSPPSDIESGISTDKPSDVPFVPEEVIESRKRFRNQCILSHILLVIAAVSIAIGLSIKFLGDNDSGDTPSPVPTILSPGTLSPSGSFPSFPTTLRPSSPAPSPPPGSPSLPPIETAGPTPVDPTADLLELLTSNSFDDGAGLNEPGSPQNRAYDWILVDPGLSGYSQERILQRYALATFYYSTGGDNWEENTLWLSDEDECNWFSRTASYPVCQLNKYVTLELDFNNLEGTIPNEVALLSKLERVELSGGPDLFLSGSLPIELELLTGLDYVSLRGNQLTGTIENIDKWSLIRTLNLSLNRFRSTIPSGIGALTRLSEIFLGSNAMFGSVPSEIGQATKLFRLSLGKNTLSGSIPSEIGNLSELRYIYTESNNFSSLCTEVGLLSNLLVVAMFENSLAMPLPSELGELSLLRSLLMSNNTLSSSIPSELGMLGSQLGNLDLSNNGFSGEIPTEIGLLTALRTLELQHNMISGTFPADLAGLERLNKIRVDSNAIVGEVPMGVCESYSTTLPLFYADCPDEIECSCCTYCCTDNECTCVHTGTELEFLC